MANRQSGGIASEYIVAGELMRRGLKVYMQCGNLPFDMIVMTDKGQLYKIEVKSVRGYNRILGVHRKIVQQMGEKYILVIHYRLEKGQNEFYYLKQEQLLENKEILPEHTERGDLLFKKEQRKDFECKNLDHLVKFLGGEQGKGKKQNLESENQRWVIYEPSSKILSREPENENDVLCILWKLEALNALPFKEFQTLGHAGSGPDLIAHFQEDCTE